MNINKIFKIRDGVDLYLNNNDMLTIYFMNTRLRKQFKVSDVIIKILELIDGEKSIISIHNELEKEMDAKIDIENIMTVFKKLTQLNAIVEKKNNHADINLINRYDRQINFFGDFINGNEESIKAQEKLRDSNVLIFGCGSIGGDIAIQLAMCGVENFILYDYDVIEESDVSRHMYFKEEYVGIKK